MENFVYRLRGEIMPMLRNAKFDACADTLQAELDRFDADCAPPYNHAQMERQEAKKAFDKSARSIAIMHKILYRQFEDHCSFAEHGQLLETMKGLTEEFCASACPKLKKLGLAYYEFDKMMLTIEGKLGTDMPLHDDSRKDRSRRRAKDPDRLEAAIFEYLNMIIPLRAKILNTERQDKFDQLVYRTCAALVDESVLAPIKDEQPERRLQAIVDMTQERLKVKNAVEPASEGEAQALRGKRIRDLVAASRTLVKIGKWIRQVDLQKTELSASRKQNIEDKLDEIKALAIGESQEAKR